MTELKKKIKKIRGFYTKDKNLSYESKEKHLAI